MIVSNLLASVRGMSIRGGLFKLYEKKSGTVTMLFCIDSVRSQLGMSFGPQIVGVVECRSICFYQRPFKDQVLPF